MKYTIKKLQPPQVLVEYCSEDEQRRYHLMVRIDPKPDGTLPQGAELDEYILQLGPTDLDVPPQDPYEGVDWTHIQEMVSMTKEEENAERRAKILYELSVLDMKSIRALREGNTAMINQIETQAEALRVELRSLA